MREADEGLSNSHKMGGLQTLDRENVLCNKQNSRGDKKISV